MTPQAAPERQPERDQTALTEHLIERWVFRISLTVLVAVLLALVLAVSQWRPEDDLTRPLVMGLVAVSLLVMGLYQLMRWQDHQLMATWRRREKGNELPVDSPPP